MTRTAAFAAVVLVLAAGCSPPASVEEKGQPAQQSKPPATGPAEKPAQPTESKAPGPAQETSPAAPKPGPEAGTQVIQLFNGKDLDGWKILSEDWFTDHGKVYVKDGAIYLDPGNAQTGISWKGEFPRTDYEVSLEAKRVEGEDFFCGMTFPIGEGGFATWIVGGWGGHVVGLSNVDGANASENQTTKSMEFEKDRWYSLRLLVTDERIECWIDLEKIIDLARGDHKFAVWPNQESVRPFGVATWHTGGALKNFRLRRLAPIPGAKP